MNGPTIWRRPWGSARRTEKPSPRSRMRGTTTSSRASHERLSPSSGSLSGIQLMLCCLFLHFCAGVDLLTMTLLGTPSGKSTALAVGRGDDRHPSLPFARGGGLRPARTPMIKLCRRNVRFTSPDESAVAQLIERLLQLGLRVHDNRPVP